jgi:transketolase
VRVVSMPCTSVFDRQDAAWRERCCRRKGLPRVVVEAGVTDFWCKYVGLDGAAIGMDRFGESAPAAEVPPLRRDGRCGGRGRREAPV